MKADGHIMASRWIFPALLLVCGELFVAQTSCAACSHYVTSRSDAAFAQATALDPQILMETLPELSRELPAVPTPPKSPCAGLTCGQDFIPPVAVPRVVRHLDLWGVAFLGELAAPAAGRSLLIEDDCPPPFDWADRLSRPPR